MIYSKFLNPLLLALPLCTSAAQAAPLLRCHVGYALDDYVFDYTPTDNPYTAESKVIDDRFRFKAVMIGDAQHVEYVKIYVYADTPRQPTPLLENVYLSPTPQAHPSDYALTGKNVAYSPRLGRELRYGCALIEVTP